MAGTRERMRAALPVAMKARDAVAVAARGYDEAGRPDRAQRLRAEAEVLSAYLD